MKRLLLLGAGHAHLQVLQAIAAEPLPGVQVALLTPYAQATYSGMVPGVVAGHYTLAQAQIALAPLLAAARVEWIEGAATGLDAAARTVRVGDRTERGDMLSVDTGGAPDRDTIPGAAAQGLFVRPVDAFVALWPRLVALADERALGIVVVGGGAAGVEVALAIQHALGARTRVSLVTGGVLLDDHPARVQRLARAALKRAAVTVFDDTCTTIAADHVQLGRGMTLQCDAPVVATGAAAPAWLSGSGLALDARGFAVTGPTLQSVSHPHVFVAGDVASRPDAPQARKSGVHAVRAGRVLAVNLRRALAGGELVAFVPPGRALNLISCGAKRAIATWGPWAAEGAWAWRWKDHIDRAWIARFSGSGATRAGGSR